MNYKEAGLLAREETSTTKTAIAEKDDSRVTEKEIVV
jgi:hypothetical protein